MKHLILFPLFILVLSTTSTESISEFILTRKFNYELGTPRMHVNNMEVCGPTLIENEFKEWPATRATFHSRFF